MKKIFSCLFVTIFLSIASLGSAQEVPHPDIAVLTEWHAGATVDTQAVALFGIDNCFIDSAIPDAIWLRMQGKTYKPNPYIQRNDLRYLRVLHCDYDQKTHLGEIVCNKLIASRLLAIFKQLYQASYPIEHILLPDVYDANDERQMRANNSSCFCYRSVSKSAKLSMHARGLAIDLNTLYNPYYKRRADGTLYVQPSTGRPYCDRSKSFRYKIDHNDLAYRLFKEQGFAWGGDWRSCKDFQHFEFVEK